MTTTYTTTSTYLGKKTLKSEIKPTEFSAHATMLLTALNHDKGLNTILLRPPYYNATQFENSSITLKEDYSPERKIALDIISDSSKPLTVSERIEAIKIIMTKKIYIGYEKLGEDFVLAKMLLDQKPAMTLFQKVELFKESKNEQADSIAKTIISSMADNVISNGEFMVNTMHNCYDNDQTNRVEIFLDSIKNQEMFYFEGPRHSQMCIGDFQLVTLVHH